MFIISITIFLSFVQFFEGKNICVGLSSGTLCDELHGDIESGVDSVQNPGDHVFIRSGFYNLTDEITITSSTHPHGRLNNSIVIQAYPGEIVNIRMLTNVRHVFHFWGVKYWKFFNGNSTGSKIIFHGVNGNSQVDKAFIKLYAFAGWIGPLYFDYDNTDTRQQVIIIDNHGGVLSSPPGRGILIEGLIVDNGNSSPDLYTSKMIKIMASKADLNCTDCVFGKGRSIWIKRNRFINLYATHTIEMTTNLGSWENRHITIEQNYFHSTPKYSNLKRMVYIKGDLSDIYIQNNIFEFTRDDSQLSGIITTDLFDNKMKDIYLQHNLFIFPQNEIHDTWGNIFRIVSTSFNDALYTNLYIVNNVVQGSFRSAGANSKLVYTSEHNSCISNCVIAYNVKSPSDVHLPIMNPMLNWTIYDNFIANWTFVKTGNVPDPYWRSEEDAFLGKSFFFTPSEDFSGATRINGLFTSSGAFDEQSNWNCNPTKFYYGKECDKCPIIFNQTDCETCRKSANYDPITFCFDCFPKYSGKTCGQCKNNSRLFKHDCEIPKKKNPPGKVDPRIWIYIGIGVTVLFGLFIFIVIVVIVIVVIIIIVKLISTKKGNVKEDSQELNDEILEDEKKLSEKI